MSESGNKQACCCAELTLALAPSPLTAVQPTLPACHPIPKAIKHETQLYS